MTGTPAAWVPVPVLSIVVPVYNEIATIGRMLVEVAKAIPEVPKQLVIVDDKSSDGTSDWLRKNLGRSAGSWRRVMLNAEAGLELCADGPANHAGISFNVLFHERNRGVSRPPSPAGSRPSFRLHSLLPCRPERPKEVPPRRLSAPNSAAGLCTSKCSIPSDLTIYSG